MDLFSNPVQGLFSFALSYFIIAAIPGANFAVVTDAALTVSRSHALRAVLGIVAGAGVLALIVATGAGLILHDRSSRHILSFGFAAYMGFLSIRAIAASARMPSSAASRGAVTAGRCFRTGCVTAALNPTTALFIATSLPPGAFTADPHAALAPVLVVIAIAGGWFGTVAMVLSRFRTRFAGERATMRLNLILAILYAVLALRTLAPVMNG